MQEAEDALDLKEKVAAVTGGARHLRAHTRYGCELFGAGAR